MADTVIDQARTRLEVERIDGDTVYVRVPGNAYSIALIWAGAESPAPGWVVGHVQASALKLEHATSGGRFIEPVAGAPRIMAGQVEAIDRESATIAVRSVLSVHVGLERRVDLGSIEVGDMVNFHVRSGARFVPEA